jgi:DNA polymerase (family 10)
MELLKAKGIAQELVDMLAGSCERIEVAGSIRRLKRDVGDIELLCIPRIEGGVDLLDKELGALTLQGILGLRFNKLGRRVYGPKNKLMVHKPSGIGVDIFSTTEENWWVSLVVRTGGKTTNQRISMAAIDKGLRFHAYGRGFSSPQGEIVCNSEREVFEAVGLPYLPPEKRE